MPPTLFVGYEGATTTIAGLIAKYLLGANHTDNTGPISRYIVGPVRLHAKLAPAFNHLEDNLNKVFHLDQP